jgi:hypothetical protein
MTHIAVAETLDLHEHRVLVTIHENLLHGEPVSRGFSLGPEVFPRTAIKGGKA